MAEKTKSLEKTSRNRSETSSHARISTFSVSPSRFAPIQSTAGNMAVQRAAREVGGEDAGVRVAAGGINDPQEAEADRVAQAVMSGNTSTSYTSGGARNAGSVGVARRKSEAGNTCGSASTVSFGASGGRGLDSTSRAFFEPHFGDLSHVRIHDNESAAATAASIGARSYTAGSDIGFAPGQFAPNTSEGRKLIAHELAHVAQGSAIVRRQPTDEQKKFGDRPMLRRVTRHDIAGRGPAPADWQSQFDPQRPPVDPTDVSSIKEAQAWVTDLQGFARDEMRRFKIASHLKSMIERLPAEVWLPTNEVIGRSTAKDGSTLIVTGVSGPINTDNIRNKLYTNYLRAERPADLNKPRDPTGLIWDWEIEQFVSDEEKATAERFGAVPDPRPFQISTENFTENEVRVLEFLFSDEMLEWRRRDLEVRESIEREEDRRTGVFMGALGEGSIRAIGQFFKYTALVGTGMAAAPGVSGWIAGRLGVAGGAEGLAQAGWGMRFIVGTGTGEVIGAGTGAVDKAISNAPDVISGDMSLADYVKDIGSGAWSGAKGGALPGGVMGVAAPHLQRFLNFLWPTKIPTPSFTPKPATPTPVPKPAAPTPSPRPFTPRPTPTPATSAPAPDLIEPIQANVGSAPKFSGPRGFLGRTALWFRFRAGEPIARGVSHAGGDIMPSISGSGRSVPTLRVPSQANPPALAAESPVSIQAPATPAPSSTTATAGQAATSATPAPATPAAGQGITLGIRPILVDPTGQPLSGNIRTSAPVSTAISNQELATLPNITAAEIQSLQRISPAAWTRIILYATTNRNEFSVKGKIGEELYFASAASQTRRDQAVQLAAALNFPGDSVQFSQDVRGQTPTRTSAGGTGELGDGMFYAIRNGYLYVLAVVESKSPSNKGELSRKVSEGKSEHAGQPGWDFERFREVPTTVNGQTFEPDKVLISRRFTQWIGVLPQGESLSARSVSHIRTQVPSIQIDNLDVSDSVLNDLARLIISRLPPRD